MKVNITSEGCLNIEAEDSVEVYALSQWCKSVEYNNEIEKICINFGSFNIEGYKTNGFYVNILDEECDK